jgi:hypothetical protein
MSGRLSFLCCCTSECGTKNKTKKAFPISMIGGAPTQRESLLAKPLAFSCKLTKTVWPTATGTNFFEGRGRKNKIECTPGFFPSRNKIFHRFLFLLKPVTKTRKNATRVEGRITPCNFLFTRRRRSTFFSARKLWMQLHRVLSPLPEPITSSRNATEQITRKA